MPLKAVVENLESVDEQHRSLYQPERDSDGKDTGRFIVAIESTDGYSLEPVEQLKSTLSKVRTERSDLDKKLKTFEGIDPKKVKALEQEVETLRATDAETEERINKIVESQTTAKLDEAAARLEQAQGEFQSQLNDSESEKEQLRESLKQVLVSDRAKAIAESISDDPHLLAPLLERQMKCVIDEKGPRVQFVDEQGTPRIGKDINSDMTDSEFIEYVQKEAKYATLIRSDQQPGSGPKAPNGGQIPNSNPTYDPNAPAEERKNAIQASINAQKY